MCPENDPWILAFAGTTATTPEMSFPRRRESMIRGIGISPRASRYDVKWRCTRRETEE